MIVILRRMYELQALRFPGNTEYRPLNPALATALRVIVESRMHGSRQLSHGMNRAANTAQNGISWESPNSGPLCFCVVFAARYISMAAE